MRTQKPVGSSYGIAIAGTPVVLNTAAPVPSNAARAYFTVDTAAVRWRADGSNPASGAAGGILMPIGTTIIEGWDVISKMRFIQDVGAAVLNVQYFSVE